MVMAQRAGYEQQATMAIPMLAVKAGQPIDDYKIVMAEQAVIAGRVVDEYGDPVQNMAVGRSSGDRDAPAVRPFTPDGNGIDGRPGGVPPRHRAR